MRQEENQAWKLCGGLEAKCRKCLEEIVVHCVPTAGRASKRRTENRLLDFAGWRSLMTLTKAVAIEW